MNATTNLTKTARFYVYNVAVVNRDVKSTYEQLSGVECIRRAADYILAERGCRSVTLDNGIVVELADVVINGIC